MRALARPALVLSTLFAASCAPAPGPRDPVSAPRLASSSSAHTATALPSSSAPGPAQTPHAPAIAGVLEEVLSPDVLGKTEIGFSAWHVDEGLLVVRDMPAAAFLVTSREARALPGYFDGLHTPVPEWDALDFSVTGVRGKLTDLSFTMGAPASGEEREVRGTTSHWKVGRATPKPPDWLSPDVVSLPVKLPSGAQIFERAAGYQSEARLGFRFVFEGTQRGDALPVPAPGKNGCKYRLLGHPFLTTLSDGSLMGIGTECHAGSDLVSTAKVDGVAWPYQTLVPRVGVGSLVAEIWSNGKSRVVPLPGAEAIAEFSGVAISARAADDVVVLAQVPGKTDSQLYVAAYDGNGFREITPPHPPFWAEPYRTLAGTLFLFGDECAF